MNDHSGIFKTLLEQMIGKGLSDKAKLVAILSAVGLSDREEMERLLECKPSTLRAARQLLKQAPEIQRQNSSSARNPAPEIQRERQNSSETPEIQRQNSSGLARANKESLRDTLSPESKQESPKPPMGAFDDPANHAGIVIAEGGSVRLVNGTRQFWLDKFDGDAKRLDLALLQVSIQPNSRIPVLAQVARQLGKQAAEKYDRDERYKSAAAANQAKAKKKFDLTKISRYG